MSATYPDEFKLIQQQDRESEDKKTERNLIKQIRKIMEVNFFGVFDSYRPVFGAGGEGSDAGLGILGPQGQSPEPPRGRKLQRRLKRH